MEEASATRFWSRPNELHATTVGRAFWQRYRTAGREAEPTRSTPYEANYDIRHGYEEPRE